MSNSLQSFLTNNYQILFAPNYFNLCKTSIKFLFPLYIENWGFKSCKYYFHFISIQKVSMLVNNEVLKMQSQSVHAAKLKKIPHMFPPLVCKNQWTPHNSWRCIKVGAFFPNRMQCIIPHPFLSTSAFLIPSRKTFSLVLVYNMLFHSLNRFIGSQFGKDKSWCVV